MKTRFILWFLPLAWASGLVGAQTAPLASTPLQVKARAPVPDLSCVAAPRRPSTAGAQDPDPLEVPDEDEVRQQMSAGGAMAERTPAPANGPWAGLGGRRGQALKVAIWGDSHQAAGFFSGELVRLLQWPADAVAPWIVPASMNRPGVRLALRKTCTSEHWRYEPAYHMADAAAQPGPGLVSMSAALPGAQLSWDLRNANGVADKSRIRILYQQTVQAIRLGVTVDGGEEQVVELRAAAGPSALELLGDGPLSVVTVRLLEGQLRWQGLELPVAASTRLVMDVFGYPGATVAAWRRADADKLRAWWPEGGYDLVILAFGTNEGNVRPFDSASYFQTLKASVGAWRQQFPQAACVLIGPGDRGVLVRRSENAKSKKPGQRPPVSSGAKKQGNTPSAKNSSAKNRSAPSSGHAAPAAPAAGKASSQDLLKYTRIHEEIGAMQEKLAQEHGCRYWSMLEAMGGSGGAYRWVRNTPPWMAKDLIHFTVPGYQRLAQLFAEDIGWQKSLGQGQP